MQKSTVLLSESCLWPRLSLPQLIMHLLVILCIISSYPTTGNADFAFDLALWTFKQRGVLRVAGVDHHLVGESAPPVSYTIEDKVVSKLLIYHKCSI